MLQVLRCKKCDAPLVLGDSGSVACGACGEINPVPEAYRELHRARVADTGARAAAERLLRRLDRPPSMVAKVLARTLDQNMFVFMLVFGIPVLLGSIMFALRAMHTVARAFHYRSVDDVPFGWLLAVITASVFVCVFVPRAIGVYANRRVADRTKLLAALAARPPAVPGAAASCRICGAPLAVEKDAIVAVCSYCRAQNAVHLETKVAVETSAVAAAVGREMDAAARRDADERAATRRMLWKELRRYALRTALIAGGFWLGSRENPDHTTSTLGIIGLVGTVLLFIAFVLGFMSSHDDDTDERRAGNDVPEWVGWVGPIVVLVLLYSVC